MIMKNPHHTPLSTCVIGWSGGTGCLTGLYFHQIVAARYGPEMRDRLCITSAAFDVDQASASMALPASGEGPATAFSPAEFFIPPPVAVQELRRAAQRSANTAPLAQHIPADFNGDSATGAAKDRRIARLILAGHHREISNLISKRFADARDARRIALLRDDGFLPQLDLPTQFIVVFNGYGGTGIGWAPDLGVIAGNLQQLQGTGATAIRRAVVLLPRGAGGEVRSNANFLAFLREVWLSHKYPGRFASTGFGDRRQTLGEPLFHEIFLVSPTSNRLVAESRDDIAFRAAQIVFNLTIGNVASRLNGLRQDALRHLLDAQTDQGFGPRIFARCGTATLRFTRDDMLSRTADEITGAVSQYLRNGATHT